MAKPENCRSIQALIMAPVVGRNVRKYTIFQKYWLSFLLWRF